MMSQITTTPIRMMIMGFCWIFLTSQEVSSFTLPNFVTVIGSTTRRNKNKNIQKHWRLTAALPSYQTAAAASVIAMNMNSNGMAEDATEESNRRMNSNSNDESNSNNNGNGNSDSSSSSGKSGIGRWEEIHGNYLLRPSTAEGQQQPPRALIHFLGGAFVGAAPDITYRYLLERLASEGYIIVATPYNLSFDYLSTCDEIITKFETIAPSLARQYGAIPVVGLGHSCGSLLQLIITSLFPDTPRAANILMSYNNKPVNDAVPFFQELIIPLFTQLAGTRPTPTSTTATASAEDKNREKEVMNNDSIPNNLMDILSSSLSNPSALPTLGFSSTEAMFYMLDLARAAAKGELPSDDVLTNISKFLTPPNIQSSSPTKVTLPFEIRNIYQQFIQPTQKQILKNISIIQPTILNQLLDIIEQIPRIIDEVADGANDFTPSPSSIQAAIRRAYRARRTLLIQFLNDPIDESIYIENLLREAELVMRMKRPMIDDIDIQRRVLNNNNNNNSGVGIGIGVGFGAHALPLIAPPSLDFIQRMEDLIGMDLMTAKTKTTTTETTKEQLLLYDGVNELVNELVNWLDEGRL